MKKKQLSGKDLLLALLYSSGISSNYNEPIVGRTRVTKMIYLFEKEIYKEFFKDVEIKLPEFKPYHYGPFSKELFEDLRFFISIGFIKTTETNVPISSAGKYENSIKDEDADEDDCWNDSTFEEEADVELKYYLSPDGKKYVEENIWHTFSETQQNTLVSFKEKINSISLDSLLRYVYNKYPEDASESYIADRYI